MRVPTGRPADEWPTEGTIVFKDVWMRYRPELDPVLKGVTFSVAAGDKIGIVGRTGSGKSSLIVALFRIVEPYKVRLVALCSSHSVTAQVPTEPNRAKGIIRPVLCTGAYLHHLRPQLTASLQTFCHLQCTHRKHTAAHRLVYTLL